MVRLVSGQSTWNERRSILTECRADILDSTCFRIGLVAALRSLVKEGRFIGVMITASHNPEEDNGVKIVDTRGEMLAPEWEGICSQVANAPSDEAVVLELTKIVHEHRLDTSMTPRIVFGYDTRPSSSRLVKAMLDGLHAMHAEIVDGGMLTTPQLHYLVLAHNTQATDHPYGHPDEMGYYKKLAGAFQELLGGQKVKLPVVVDCANGVGAKAMQGLLDLLPKDLVDVTLLRTDVGKTGALNNGCGADFVKTNQRMPLGYENEPSVKEDTLLCSFDGDADRIVFYYLTGPASKPESFHLLDGDKIATLATDYLATLCKAAKLDIKLGCVQTAYANGASTEYLAKRVPITCTKTGVKHLHHAAERHDIGVYFEANGHGTVLFSPYTMVMIDMANRLAKEGCQDSLHKLRTLPILINQAVGDAISDLLLVLYILTMNGWDAYLWDSCYEDLPNRLAKIQVPDRFVFQTSDAERRLDQPHGLQDKIDAVVKRTPNGRAFVRPSGTEDVVRIYAEARTPDDVEALLNSVCDLVKSAV